VLAPLAVEHAQDDAALELAHDRRAELFLTLGISGERIVEDARSEIRRLEDQLVSLDRARRSYLSQIRLIVERQLSEITAAEQSAPPDDADRDASRSPTWLGSLVRE
jgi:hypothetical protein